MMVQCDDTFEVDKRDPGVLFKSFEAQIESMKRRIAELEEENDTLRFVQYEILHP